MLTTQQTSLYRQVHPIITLIFWSWTIVTTLALIWSYKQIYQYVKLIILVTIDSNPLYPFNNLSSNIPIPSIPNLNLQLTEFTLDLHDMFNAYWKGPALLPALAIVASTYIYPYLKLLVYFIVYFIPLNSKYQTYAQLVIWQLNKLMFIPFVAVCLQSVTFSFNLVLPTEVIQNAVDSQAEAYPGKGLVADIITIVCYAFADYALRVLVQFHKPKSYIFTMGNHHFERQKRYTNTSYIGIVCRCVFLCLIIGNVWILMEALMSAPLGFKIDGVLSNFVPDKYRTNNMFETGHILLTTSLLNGTTSYFLYVVYMTVFVICPCVVSVLLVVIWITPLFNKHFGFGIVARYGLKLLWFAQSWNALDVFLVCQFGATQANIKNATKYLLDTAFPEYCGADGVVEPVFDEDCSWADAWFTSSIALYIVTVAIQWIGMFYTTKVFGVDHSGKSKYTVVNP
eukprot:86712_1